MTDHTASGPPAGADDEARYLRVLTKAHTLFVRKNHHYGGAWRQMRITSMLDRMVTKITRVDTLLRTGDNAADPSGHVDEAVEDSLLDLVNEAALTLLRTQDRGQELSTETLAARYQDSLDYLEKAIQESRLALADACTALDDLERVHPGIRRHWKQQRDLWVEVKRIGGEL